MIDSHVVRRIRLDDVGSEFNSLSNQRKNFCRIAIYHVAAGTVVGLENERFYHQRHPVAVAVRFDLENILDALIANLRLIGNSEEINHNTGCIEPESLLDRVFNHSREERPRKFPAIDIGNVGAQNERRFVTSRQTLQKRRLADSELNGIGRGFDECANSGFEVFDAGKKTVFVEEAVIDSDVETVAGLGVKEALEAIRFQGRSERL